MSAVAGGAEPRPGHARGQPPDARGRLARVRLRRGPRHAGERRRVPVHATCSSRPSRVNPRPGGRLAPANAARGHAERRVLVLGREPEHDPLAEHAGQRARDVGAAVRGDDEVQAERAAVGGEPRERLHGLAVADALERRAEARVAVEEQHDAREAGVPGLTAGGDARPARRHGAAQRAQEPQHPLLVVRGDHRPHVRQRLQVAERAAGEVERVDLQLARRGGRGQRAGERAQQRRAAAAARAVDEHAAVALEVELERTLRLLRRIVDEAEHRPRRRPGVEIVQVEPLGERGQPRRARRGQLLALGRRLGAPDQELQVGGPRAAQRGEHALERLVLDAAPERTHADPAAVGDPGAAPARVGDLELDERRRPARPAAGQRDRAARQAGGDRRRVGRLDDVAALALVRHPHRQPQVRVGAQGVADRAARPLGGEHEVQAEAAPALGHVDERVEERRAPRARASRTRRRRSRARAARPDRGGPARAGSSPPRRRAAPRAGAARRAARCAPGRRAGRRGR